MPTSLQLSDNVLGSAAIKTDATAKIADTGVVASEDILIACPFYKQNPDLWRETGHCARFGKTNLSRVVKRHVLRTHSRLNEIFEANDPRRIDQQCFLDVSHWSETIVPTGSCHIYRLIPLYFLLFPTQNLSNLLFDLTKSAAPALKKTTLTSKVAVDPWVSVTTTSRSTSQKLDEIGSRFKSESSVTDCGCCKHESTSSRWATEEPLLALTFEAFPQCKASSNSPWRPYQYEESRNALKIDPEVAIHTTINDLHSLRDRKCLSTIATDVSHGVTGSTEFSPSDSQLACGISCDKKVATWQVSSDASMDYGSEDNDSSDVSELDIRFDAWSDRLPVFIAWADDCYVRSLIQDFYSRLHSNSSSGASFVTHNTTGHGSTGYADSTPANFVTNTGSSVGARGHKRGAFDEQDQASKRLRTSTDVNEQPTGPNKREQWACPFHKYDPLKYVGTDRYKRCPRGFPGINRLKQHLKSAHSPQFYCKICSKIFRSKDEDDAHRVEYMTQPCQADPFSILDEMINTDRKRRALAKKLVKPVRTNFEHWFEMWDWLFEGFPRPDSPYVDLSDIMFRFQAFVPSQEASFVQGFATAHPDWNLPEPVYSEFFQYLTGYLIDAFEAHLSATIPDGAESSNNIVSASVRNTAYTAPRPTTSWPPPLPVSPPAPQQQEEHRIWPWVREPFMHETMQPVSDAQFEVLYPLDGTLDDPLPDGGFRWSF